MMIDRGRMKPNMNIETVYILIEKSSLARYFGAADMTPMTHVAMMTYMTGRLERLKCSDVYLTAAIRSRLMAARHTMDVIPDSISNGMSVLNMTSLINDSSEK